LKIWTASVHTTRLELPYMESSLYLNKKIHVFLLTVDNWSQNRSGFFPSLKTWISGPGQSKMAMPETYYVE